MAAQRVHCCNPAEVWCPRESSDQDLHGCVQKCRKCTRRRTLCAQSDQTSGDALSASSATGVLGRSYCVIIPGVNRLALGPRSRYQKLIHDLDPSAWYKATDGFGPSRTDAQADQALCFPVLCGDRSPTCMRVWSSKHRGLSARRAALPWNLAFWLSITTATRPARYSSVELFGPLFRIPHPFAASWNPSPGTN